MPISSQALAALQSAGAAVFAAGAALKDAVKGYAGEVKQSMLENPFDVGNDGLFNDWKSVARLSRAVGQVEAEVQNIYRATSSPANGGNPVVLIMPTLSASQAAGSEDLAIMQEIKATDVVAKKQEQKRKAAKVSVMAAVSPRTKPATRNPLKGNSAKLLKRLLEILNPDHFVKINRAAVGAEIGLPKGSVGASINELLETGHLIESELGKYKLSKPRGV